MLESRAEQSRAEQSRAEQSRAEQSRAEQSPDLKICMLAVFAWGVIAHAYGFLNFTIGHDSLAEFYTKGWPDEWKIQLGRVLVPLYRYIAHGAFPTTGLIGILALVWIGLAVYLVCRLFKLTSKIEILLISGVMTTNITITAQSATYIYELDGNMLAMLLAVMAVYFWANYRNGFLVGSVFAAAALSIYQSYISVSIALIMIQCIVWLLEGETAKSTFKVGIKGIIMLVCAGVEYLLLVKIVCTLTNTSLSTDSYNSLTNAWGSLQGSILGRIVDIYVYWIRAFIKPIGLGNSVIILFSNVLLAIVTLGIVLFAIFTKRVGILEGGLLVAIGALLPIGMNISCGLSGGMVHHLMMYAFWFVYLLAMLLIRWVCKAIQRKNGLKGLLNVLRIAPAVLIMILVWNNIQVANTAYLKRELVKQTTLSLMTRVVDRMEQQDGYIPGETPVVILGKEQLTSQMTGFESIDEITGMSREIQITYDLGYKPYFEYIINEPVNLCTKEITAEIQNSEMIKQMPCFPQNGSIKMVGEVLVVKFGEP